VDYRLAPEYPFPAPRDDAYEALNWAIGNAATYNIDTRRIGVWGISAGGNIAASIALQDSIEHEATRIRHLNLIVPVTCHPDIYPSVLKSKNGSMQRFPFGGEAGTSNAALKRLWSKSPHLTREGGSANIAKVCMLETKLRTSLRLFF
jgi:hypothetical protein